MLTCSVQRNAAEEMIGTKLTAVKHFCEPKMPVDGNLTCLLYTSPSPRDGLLSRMPSSA